MDNDHAKKLANCSNLIMLPFGFCNNNR